MKIDRYLEDRIKKFIYFLQLHGTPSNNDQNNDVSPIIVVKLPLMKKVLVGLVVPVNVRPTQSPIAKISIWNEVRQ